MAYAEAFTAKAGSARANGSCDRLLVIDDEIGFRNLVRRVAEAAGFETIVTEAAAVFREQLHAWHPSVIIIDLNMPGADGVELLRDMAEAKTKAHVLIASGADAKVLSSVEALAAQRGLAIAGTLPKPIRPAHLRETLERLREFEQPLLAHALSHAIENGDLLLQYQPKLDFRSGRIGGVEALVRWQHATRGIVPPDRFIALAEESGLIHQLTQWVFASAVGQAAAWRRDGLPLDVAINLSPLNLQRMDLPDWMAMICAAAGLEPKMVTLELTETAAMGDPAQTMDVLTRLRLKGFELSIDDFGTGYSSLAQLRKLPFSELKVDQSFVKQMDRDTDSRVIVEAVVGLGRKLGLCVVAEGVESAAALDALRAMEADAAQGFFISRPVDADKLPETVAALADGTPRRAADRTRA